MSAADVGARYVEAEAAGQRGRSSGSKTARGHSARRGSQKITGLLTKWSGGFRVVEPSGIEPLTS
jgi:hypothetical protein